MAENRRGRDNRYYFSRGQLVLLGGAFTLTAVIIFILGMFVGQVIEENKMMKQEEPLVKFPVSPAGQGTANAQPPPARDEITFNNSAAKTAGAEAAAPMKAREPRGLEKAVRSQPKEVQAANTSEATAEPRAGARAEKASPASEAPRKSAPGAANEAKERGLVWRAQVNAFPDDRSAHQLVERLKNKGYNAYVSEVQNRGKTWYRVSIGKYPTRAEAEKVVNTMQTKENFPKAFAASD